jgi:uncharacterized membrane protein YfcA
MKTAICMIVFGAIGMLGTAWLGAAIDTKWLGAITCQFTIFLCLTMGGIWMLFEHNESKK